jgi:hypothetical protein
MSQISSLSWLSDLSDVFGVMVARGAPSGGWVAVVEKGMIG